MKNPDGYVFSVDDEGYTRITPPGDMDLISSGSNKSGTRGRLAVRHSPSNTNPGMSILSLEYSGGDFGFLQIVNNADASGEALSYLGRRDSEVETYKPVTYIGSHEDYNKFNLNINNSGLLGVGTWDPKTGLDLRGSTTQAKITMAFDPDQATEKVSIGAESG